MLRESVLGDVLDQIRIAREDRQRCLIANSQSVKTLRAEVQRRKAELRRELQRQAQSSGRILRRFVEQNRNSTRRFLSNARSNRARHAMRHQFDIASGRNERRRVVQSILRRSSTMRRIAEGQRLRSAATSLASIRATVSRIKQVRGALR